MEFEEAEVQGDNAALPQSKAERASVANTELSVIDRIKNGLARKKEFDKKI